MGVALDDALRAKLEASAAAKGHSLAAEIRQRLERDYKQEAIDPVTRELIAGILNLAELIRADANAPWHSGRWAHQAFAAAVAQRLTGYQPPDLAPEGSAFTDLFGAPETVGHAHERADQRTNPYQHLKAAQEQRQRKLVAAAARHLKKKGDDK
jgi:hypothetical protein